MAVWRSSSRLEGLKFSPFVGLKFILMLFGSNFLLSLRISFENYWAVYYFRLTVLLFCSFWNNLILFFSELFLILVFKHLSPRPFVSIQQLEVVIQQLSEEFNWMIVQVWLPFSLSLWWLSFRHTIMRQ